MSKFGVQQLFVRKVIPPSGYGSRKSAWLSSALMGWFIWVLSVFLIGLGIALPVHADEDCKPKSVAFEEWCHEKATGSLYNIHEYFDKLCIQRCYIERYPFASDSLERYASFAQECETLGGKSETEGLEYTCLLEGNQEKKNPPQANFTLSPSEGVASLTVSADGNASTDSDGSIASYQWSTSDGKTASGPTASFVFDKEGDYTITLTVTDNDGLTGSTQHSVTVTDSEISVTGITSQYPEKTHFLDGVDHEVIYTAEIDWGEQEPGTVSFITPKTTKEVNATGNSAEQQFNMGQDFGVCGKLKVVATSKSGKKKSPEKEADFVIMSEPFLAPDFQLISGGNSFHYSFGTVGLNWDLIDDVFGPAGTSDPIFGKYLLGVKFIPTVDVKIDSEGKTEVGVDWEGASKPVTEGKDGENIFKVGDFKIELHPKIDVNGIFQKDSCEWQWGGDVGLSGGGNLSMPPFKFVVFAGPVPVPMYAKFTFAVSASGAFTIEKVEPFTPKGGKLAVSPSARGSLGVGESDILAGEGWIQASGELGWEAPPIEWKRGAVMGKIGATVVVFSWKWEGEALSCEWDFAANNGKCTSPFIRSRQTTNPTLVERDYLTNPNYGTLRKSTRELRDSQPVPLQLAVYPYSDADTSGNNNALYATWLSDNPARAAVNRTQVVFSTWNGTDWTNPQPIADDGTADFHPKILAFSDNSALATWEDVKTTLADTAQLEDMLQAMEISVSSYNPQTQQWTDTQRLTDNTSLDRSPKLAGKITGNAIVTWISNAANDIMGSADKPNQLWSASYANNRWNTAQPVANIPYPLLKYNTAFDGQNGYVVLSVDTDGDLTTIEDHELFQLTLTNGVWSALTRLTTDTLADDNPQLGIDPNGQFVLTWLKNNEISSVVNFDLNTRTIVRTDDSGYSSNLADFKLAQTTDGKLAIVWAEPSAEHSSDLHALFYNPVGNIWGGLRQLTADSETEKRITATFFGTDTLVALYNRNQVGDVSTSTSPTTSPKVDTPVAVYTDLYMLKHTLRAIDFTKIDLPELGAIEGDTFAFDPAGNLTDTQAILSGGISINGGPFKNIITFQDNLEHGENAEPVAIKGIIIPDPKHDGKPADIFAFGEYTPYGDDLNDTTCPTQVANPEAVPFYVMESLPKNYVTWEGTKTPSSIPAFLYKNVLLKSGEAQEFILFEGPFDARGCLSISFGYRLQDNGTVVYNHHTATVDNGIGVTVRKK